MEGFGVKMLFVCTFSYVQLGAEIKRPFWELFDRTMLQLKVE
jgi:hypothetical protein